MASAKESTKAKTEPKQPAKAANTGPFMYVGPTLRTVPLMHNRVYTEIPKEATDAMAEHPELRLLFVRIERVPDVELQMRNRAGAFYTAYQAVQAL